jgi:hypothetical protein
MDSFTDIDHLRFRLVPVPRQIIIDIVDLIIAITLPFRSHTLGVLIHIVTDAPL